MLREREGAQEAKAAGGRGDRNTRVIPANFREIALTSFSRGHIAIAARPFVPGPFYG